MSLRTALAIVNQGVWPEEGPATKTWENMDVALGSKIPWELGLVCSFRNTHSSALNLTYTYDDDRGVERTKVVSVPNGGGFIAQFAPALLRHAADIPENGAFVWVTAAGTAGQLQARVTRLARHI